ncbi:MAG: serine/threonine protein phosphatase [Oscillospiraceae bacterium]|nr:serine/threonine protein phosphatase [Oscillospiraceae bacterium]
MDKRISQTFEGAPCIRLDETSKIILMSDCHRSTGDLNDNFANNENIYFTALRNYFHMGYTYIELGDGDELWENRKFSMISDQNSHIFRLLRQFQHEERLHIIYGNHDMVKKYPKWRKKNLSVCYSDKVRGNVPLFGDIDITQGLILQTQSGRKLYLLHGNQGDLLCDRLWWLGRFLVRNVWRPLELIGLKDPRSTAENRAKQNIIERRLALWAKQSGEIMIAGHTHRPHFPTPDKSNPDYCNYYNTGSCVHPRCITAIEIVGGVISLVKWGIETRKDGTLYIAKEVLESGELPT